MTGYRIVHYDAGTHQPIYSCINYETCECTECHPRDLSTVFSILDALNGIDGARRLDHVTVYIPGSSIDHIYTIEVAE